MTRPSESLISILGSSYCQPISNLIQHWTARATPTRGKVISGFYEHGYSASVILLLVAMLESYVARLRFFQDRRVPSGVRNPLEVVLCIFPTLRHRKALTEIYIIRDSITHSHLWELEYTLATSGNMVPKQAVRHPSYGDKKYLLRVNQLSRRTITLGLNVVPTRLDRTDVVKSFDVIWKTLLRFESSGLMNCYVRNERVRFRGETWLFADMVRELRR